MNTPMTTPTHTHTEAIAIARAWMVEEYGSPSQLVDDEKELWMQRFGFLVDFLHTLHPPESINPTPTINYT